MGSINASPFRETVAADLRRYGNGASLRAFAAHYCRTPGFRYTFLMRSAAYSRGSSVLLRPAHYLCRALLHHCAIKYGISIPYNTRIGPGLYIGHFGGIVVNQAAVIGRDCNLNHHVTIGEKFGGRNAGVPVIGDRAYLGPGCVVIGGIRLDDDVAVGANAVVTDSVPSSGVVAGVPARLLSRRGSADYVVNTTSAG